MEQQTEARTLVERGDALLYDGQVQPAAAAYAQAVQIEPGAVGGHLGLAMANLALGAFGIVYLACRQVQSLAPGTADAALARAILFVLERRYDDAVQSLDEVAELDPGRAYAHALRGYCLRLLGRTYDAQQAEAKARRLSSGKNFAPLFPQVDLAPGAAPMAPRPLPSAPPRDAPHVRSWENASPMRRQAVRFNFATRGIPLVTFTLIGINVFIYLLTALSVGDLFSPQDHLLVVSATGAVAPQSGPIYYYGVQVGSVMFRDPSQWYRVLTAMFLHASIAHIGLNMLSLYFVGVVTEQLFGRWRFVLIYFAGGIVGGLAQAFLSPTVPSLGASGAIFGIFGAFGAFIILRRNLLGNAAGPIIGQWMFWLVLNLWFSFANATTIGVADHVGGLVSGFVLGALLIPDLMAKMRR